MVYIIVHNNATIINFHNCSIMLDKRVLKSVLHLVRGERLKKIFKNKLTYNLK